MKYYHYLKTSQKHILVLLIHLVQTLCLQFQIGKYTTLKHTSLGLGLHSMTGMKNPMNILDRLGHSISYDMVCWIETAQVEVSQKLLKTSNTPTETR